MNTLLNASFFGVKLQDLLMTLAIVVVIYGLVTLANILVIKKIEKRINTNGRPWMQTTVTIIGKLIFPVSYTVAFYALLSLFKIPSPVRGYIDIAFKLFIFYFLIKFILALMDSLFSSYLLKKETETNKTQSLIVLKKVITVLIWGLMFFILLDSMGINISALVAGLGIGGIALALAAQTILGDLFNSFVIFFDKPFEVGDFIIIENYMGTVEHIGIKTTRIRSLSGEQMVFSNTDLTTARVRNFKRMNKRRVSFSFGVTYRTSSENLAAIPSILKDIISDIPATSFERAHFSSLAESALHFEVVYYVNSADYNQYMDIQQEINLHIFEAFSEKGISFAYPTQTIWIEK